MATPKKKVSPLFLTNPTPNVEVLSSPPSLKIWLEAQTPPCINRDLLELKPKLNPAVGLLSKTRYYTPS